ncbi:MAG: glycosyltransferase family 2 protein [Blastocatellia bacterium]
MKLSVVIPAHNEAGSIEPTIRGIVETLRTEGIDHEVVVVDDASTDGTLETVAAISIDCREVRYVKSENPPGFGFAVRCGLDSFEGDAVAIVMADGSDSPEDLVTYYQLLVEGYDCAFGSRFIPGAQVLDYPRVKLILNRIANKVIQLLFRHGYNDTTNAFKGYRREVIDSVRPFLSNHFNLTVELPLKAIIRGYSYAIVPISWTNRTEGNSKFGVNEMGSRYAFIILYAFLEHHLSRGDYRRSGIPKRRPQPGLRAEDPSLEVQEPR